MRGIQAITLTLTTALLLASPATTSLHAQDGDIPVEDGGIHIDGWAGAIDARAAEGGATLADARLEAMGEGLHVRTGPATTYWRTDERLTGDYTVTATFTEPEYMALNNHPHPYGLVIAGNDMGTDSQSLLYCMAYGNGRFIVRGFGPEAFQLNGRRPEAHPAVNQAAGEGEPVTQEIAMSVRGDTIECAINGTVVASYDRSEVVADGRLASTDGMYGLRFGHNTEAHVEGLTVTRGSR